MVPKINLSLHFIMSQTSPKCLIPCENVYKQHYIFHKTLHSMLKRLQTSHFRERFYVYYRIVCSSNIERFCVNFEQHMCAHTHTHTNKRIYHECMVIFPIRYPNIATQMFLENTGFVNIYIFS